MGQCELPSLLRHDPRTQGPILITGFFRYPLFNEEHAAIARALFNGKTPTQFAEGIGCRVLSVGDITAVVPRSMKVFVKNPAKPDPYAGLSFDDRFLLLLSRLTPEQWKRTGGAEGIGAVDLTADQQRLYEGLWRGDAVVVRTTRIVPKQGDDSDTFTAGEESVPAGQIRLRLSRRASLGLFVSGKEDYSRVYPHMPERRSGRETGAVAEGSPPGEPQPDGSFLLKEVVLPDDNSSAVEDETVTAYGVPVIITVPNQPKPCGISLDAPALQTPFRLDGSRKTIGALLTAVSDATRLRFVADKQFAVLPVRYKVAAGGQSVPAGDVLKVLCRSVTGTFRRLDSAKGETLYLLTDDVEGVGTRFARLDRWARNAGIEESRITRQSLDDCAEGDFLSALHLAPDDPFTLSAAQIKTMDDAYHSPTGKNLSSVPVNELSPALREEVSRGIASWKKDYPDVSLRSDRVRLNADFHCDWLLPGGQVYPAQFEGLLKFPILREFALPWAKLNSLRDQTPITHPTPMKFPRSLKRRVLVVPLPESDANASVLLTLLRCKGFTEAWFRVPSSDAATRERLRSTIARGSKAGVRVGAVIPWLLKSEPGDDAVPDVNILGERGTPFVEGVSGRGPGSSINPVIPSECNDHHVGWVVPDPPASVARLTPFLSLPGLCAAVFVNSAAPGYTHNGEQENWYLFGNADGVGELLGYTTDLRYAVESEKGFDPVDVVSHSTSHVGSWLNRYSASESSSTLSRFRYDHNKAFLARIFAGAWAAAPRLPLYLEDRLQGINTFSYYSRWDRADAVPNGGSMLVFNAKRLHKEALRTSSAPVLSLVVPSSTPIGPRFWNDWHHGAAEAGAAWDGFSICLPYAAFGEITAFLRTLPDDAPPAAPRPTWL